MLETLREVLKNYIDSDRFEKVYEEGVGGVDINIESFGTISVKLEREQKND